MADEMSGRIFITHATNDDRLAEVFIDLLVSGADFAASQIFCSSVEGHTIPTGVEIKGFLREELSAGAAVIGLISTNYLESTWCLCELGATWALAKEFFPILIPPMKHANLPPFLASTQSLLVGDEGHLDRLCDELSKLHGKTCNVPKWNAKKRQFLNQLPEIIRAWADSASTSGTGGLVERPTNEASRRRLLIGPVSSSLELARSPKYVLSATGVAIRNAYVRRQNVLHNISVEFTFSYFDVETFRVKALLTQVQPGGEHGALTDAVSLRQGEACHALLLASRMEIPLMAAVVERYYTISNWPFNPARERHLYEGEWILRMELRCDSTEENLIQEYTLQIGPGSGFGIAPGAPR